jgi:hypothetical protein
MIRTRILAIVCLGVCLLSPAFAQGATPNGLYFRIRMAFGTISQDHWWFLQDGRYLNLVPSDGLDPSVYEANCQKMPAVCGTYKVQGDKLQLVPRKGKPLSLDFRLRPDGNLNLDGLFTKHVDVFGSNL